MTGRFQAVAVLVVLLAMCAPAAAGVTTTFYGYIKLDASLDSAMTDKGDFAFIVMPYEEGKEDDEFNMTANQTRLGVKLDGGGSDAIAVSGLIEFDLYGGGPENKPNPLMRKAYMEFKTDVVDILAGQTSDIISPLFPTTLNYIALRKSGNIGFRRPQVRLSKNVEIADGTKLSIAASANRNMGPGENGEDAGMPSFQGRLAVGTKLIGDKPAVIGVSGVWGQEESDDFDTDFDRTGISVDVSLPLGEMIAVKGEYFTGKNLAVYLGGIGQGIATLPPEGDEDEELVEIEASGWWAQVTIKPVENWQFNVGGGSDDPEFDRDPVGDMLEKNTTYYGNAIWTVAPSAMIGVEYAMFETEYMVRGEEETTTETYENTRLQLSFMYKF
jgi:hypothetical protein